VSVGTKKLGAEVEGGTGVREGGRGGAQTLNNFFGGVCSVYMAPARTSYTRGEAIGGEGFSTTKWRQINKKAR